MNAVRTFEGDDSSFTNDQIIAIAERIQEMRKDAKEHGASAQKKTKPEWHKTPESEASEHTTGTDRAEAHQEPHQAGRPTKAATAIFHSRNPTRSHGAKRKPAPPDAKIGATSPTKNRKR